MFLIKIKRTISRRQYMYRKGVCNMVLKDEIAIDTYGGKINYGIIAAIGSAITLIVGIIDGYLRPLRCNK